MRMERISMMKQGSTQVEPGQSTLPIHALSVENGILALCRLPGGTGHYRSDLQHINDWKPSLVLSISTPGENDSVGAFMLGADIQCMASRWYHLPVPDHAWPPAAMLSKWPKASAAARRALVGGGRVLVHGSSGAARSGMVVLRLMIELGELPFDALTRLRAIEPFAVETDEQMAWAIGAGSE